MYRIQYFDHPTDERPTYNDIFGTKEAAIEFIEQIGRIIKSRKIEMNYKKI